MKVLSVISSESPSTYYTLVVGRNKTTIHYCNRFNARLRRCRGGEITVRYRFGDYELDTRSYELSRLGERCRIEPKVFDLLVYLLAHRDRVVSKRELLDNLWPSLHISVSTLAQQLRAARKVIGDNGRQQSCIQTFHGRGYRFVATVEVVDPEAEELSPEPLTTPNGNSCPACQHVNEPKALFCVTCGVRLAFICPACSQLVRCPAGFCSACGEPLVDRSLLSEAESAPSWRESLPDAGERKMVSILAIALTHAEEEGQELGLDGWHALLSDLYTCIQPDVMRYGGVIQPPNLDGVTVVFGAPVAQEDHAQRAVFAAFDIASRLELTEGMASQTGGMPLQVRMGIHSGEVAIGGVTQGSDRMMTVIGEPMLVATALPAYGSSGMVICSDSTSSLLDGTAELKPLSSIQMAAASEPIALFQVVGQSQASRLERIGPRHVTKQFVGRQQEMALLNAAFKRVEQGEGQVVGVMGMPGIGKSRLLHEFHRQLSPDHVTYWHGDCHSYGASVPYLPLRALIRDAGQLAGAVTETAIATKLRRLMRQFELEPDRSVNSLMHVLGVGSYGSETHGEKPKVLKQQVFEVLLQCCFRSSEHRPLVLVIEDLHWIDPSSEEWLAFLAQSLAQVPILLLVTYRPGYTPPWLDKSYAMQLALAPLTLMDSRQLVGDLLATDEIDASLVQTILEKAEGNPFFLEELTHALNELDDDVLPATVPDTIQGVLAARIDHLSTEAKYVLQTLSVLGVEVTWKLLQAVTEISDDRLQQSLDQLQQAEFLSVSGALPEWTYQLKHTMIQEVAYRSLLQRSRRALHARIAPILVQHQTDIVAHYPEVLAHHYTEAGQIEDALPHWQEAGHQAVARSANAEAVELLTKALNLLQLLPQTEARLYEMLALQMALAAPLVITKGYASAEVGALYGQAHKLCQKVRLDAQMFPVLNGLMRFHAVRGKLSLAHDLAQQLLHLAVRDDDTSRRLGAESALGGILLLQGQLSAAEHHFVKAIALYDVAQQNLLIQMYGDDPGQTSMCWEVWTLWLLGRARQAHDNLQALRAFTQVADHPWTHIALMVAEAVLAQFERNVPQVEKVADQLILYSREQGFASWLALGQMLWGWARSCAGDYETGLAALHQGLEAHQATGAVARQTYYLGLLSDAYRQAGQHTKGFEALTEALTLVDKTSESFYKAELRRLQGELFLAEAVSPVQVRKAEACFRLARITARHQDAKSWELRAAISLAELWTRGDKTIAAHQLLSQVCESLPEKLDSADYHRAQVLLGLGNTSPQNALSLP